LWSRRIGCPATAGLLSGRWEGPNPCPFQINPLHNIVHLAIGLAGLALWRRLDTAKTYGWLLAVGYGLGSQRRCQSGTATRRGGLSMRELRLWAAATAGSVVAAGFYALAALRRIVGPPPSTSWAEAARWSALSIMTPVRPGIASPWRSGRICRS
jgi:hypothetical protein